MRVILQGERTALNFLQRMSGIATYTNEVASLLKGSKTKLLDTRKTTPNMRVFEKYAVKTGGGNNHRYNLSDGVMLKDNHIGAAGGITEAVKLAKEYCVFRLSFCLRRVQIFKGQIQNGSRMRKRAAGNVIHARGNNVFNIFLCNVAAALRKRGYA